MCYVRKINTMKNIIWGLFVATYDDIDVRDDEVNNEGDGVTKTGTK